MTTSRRFSTPLVVLSLFLILAAAPPPAFPGEEPAADTPAADEKFDAWLAELRTDAMARDISAETLDRALADVRPIPGVVEKDRNQPEFKMTFERYLKVVVTSKRIQKGRRMMAEHRELLNEIRSEYGVPPQFVVALWGVESDFGRRQGDYPVIAALLTLAYDGRRAAFFRGELMDALQILDDGHIAPSSMLGSWAGAMGQPQFMPSSFRNFAVDHDGDGRNDIWGSVPDVMASAANYLARNGWNERYIWGRAIRVPTGLDRSLVGRKVRRSLREWQALGVRRDDGGALPTANIQASIVQPDGAGGASFLVYDNFRVLLSWNRSDYFASAVGILSDRIAGY